MYLSKLEIIGFKSFANKTQLSFNEGLTCIIGPNGSGKSNIVDAIRWVLGEQRTTSLRSEKMENVIFNGTKERKPMGMSEVSMTIENTKKILDSEYEEIVIARRLYRSGESQYLINKIPVRLKDVVDLFMDTGMGANSYSVIELKMVESILSENKTERRQLFEEAAGVVKYKTRRKSALRKLEATQQDLTRINDIVIEVEKTVSSLSRQVSKARRYISITEELKKSEIELATYRYHNLIDQLKPLQKELVEASKEKEESSHQITLEEAILEDYNRQQIQFENTLQEHNTRLYAMDNSVRQLNQEDAIAEAKIEDMQNNQKRYADEIEDFKKKISILQENHKEHQAELIEYKNKHEVLQQKFNSISEERNKETEIINKEKAEIDLLNSTFREKLQRISQQKEYLKQKDYRVNFDKEQLEKIKNLTIEHDSEIASLRSKIKEEEINKSKTEAELKDIEKQLENLKNKNAADQQALNTKQQNYNELLSDLERIRSRETFYSNIISNYEGYSKSTQFVMSKNNIPGVYGPVSDLIEANNQEAFLVETLLRESINYIVVENTRVAKELIQLIKNEKQGRITCIPLDKLNKIISPTRPDNIKHLNFLLDSITTKDTFHHLLHILLGDVVVCENLDDAITQSEKFPGLRFITIQGEMVNFNREISGGTESKRETAIIGRKNVLAQLVKDKIKGEEKIKSALLEMGKLKSEIEAQQIVQKNINEKIDAVRQTFYSIDNKIKNFNFELNSKQQQIESATSQTILINEQITSVAQEINDLNQKLLIQQDELNIHEKETISRTKEFESKNDTFQLLLDEYQDIQLQLSNAYNQLTNRQNDLIRISANLSELENNIKRREEETENIKQSLHNFNEQIEERKSERQKIWQERDALDKKKQVVESDFQTLKEKRHTLESQIREFRRKHDSSMERTKKLEIKINEFIYHSDHIRTDITKEYATDVDALIPNQNLNDHETEENIESLKNRIKNLGPVNPLAVTEYEKENERLEFLVSQMDDLEKAEKSLLETIEKINKTAREQFSGTYIKIKENFEKVFSSFFPSGKGTLNMDTHSDPLETDIEIEVTTKGRGLQTLALLSGGEKTLTAISLLFAIYLVKPSPFCILDEVDAPLDDVNIGRFTEALKGFSNNTQFLVVTHNKRTMEAAETMYGVTMEEEGVSKLVSVQFN